MKKTLGIIIARGGSKGVPKKNILSLRGRPIISYTIEDAKKASSLDMVIVSTDDPEIAALASLDDIEVLMRPTEYATDTAPMDLALRHVVKELNQRGTDVGIVVPLYANVPVRSDTIIDRTVAVIQKSGADSVQTYSPYNKPPQWACKLSGDVVGLLDTKYSLAYRRQMLEPAYYPDGAAMAIRHDILMNAAGASQYDAFLGKDRRGIIQRPDETVDIDEPIDLLWAEFLLSKKQ